MPTKTPSGDERVKKAAGVVDFDNQGQTARQTIVVFLARFLLHTAALLFMAFIWLEADTGEPLLGILSDVPQPKKQEVDLDKVEIKKPDIVKRKERPAEIVKQDLADTEDRYEIDRNDLAPSATVHTDPKATAPSAAAPFTGEFAGRSKAGRSALVAKYGGTKQSEAAVLEGLEWLARHQRADGSWSFDHRFSGCDCKDPGNLKKSYMGATAMALLCFLGAGHTFSEGDFQQNVRKGIVYLLKHGKMTKLGGDFRGNAEGNSGMYVQALATIALCESLAMHEAARKAKLKRSRSSKSARMRSYRLTGRLTTAAKQAVYFIVNAQSSNGGWRYKPRKNADTSVVGWQIMALASGHSAGIRIVPGRTIRGASRYLDSVQSHEGARYAYIRKGSNPKPKPSMTAVGLLSRIYLGWKRGHPGIRYGVEYLSQLGPSKNDMYYNYYATQVLHQYGGELWKQWNEVMRDQLVETQRKKGHARGSWDVTDRHGNAGGRLYQTCLSIMTLEVYYRHLPLYDHRDLDSETPADSFAKGAEKKTKDDSPE